MGTEEKESNVEEVMPEEEPSTTKEEESIEKNVSTEEDVSIDDIANNTDADVEEAGSTEEGEAEASVKPTVDIAPDPKTTKGRILLVEDSIPLCRMVEKLLVSSGYEVEIGYNGKEGLRLFDKAEVPFSLLIVDIMMPEMDGIQMIAHLRKQELPDLPPIIICSSRSDAETVKLTLKLGAAAYILKPFTTETVLAKIKELIDFT